MTAAERSELQDIRDELGKRFDRLDDNIDAIDTRLRVVESFVSTAKGREEARKDVSTSRLQWVGIALACAVFIVAMPASILAILHIFALVG